MKFEFSFKATPTISCCFPSRPDIENVMLEIIEKSPSRFTSTIDNTDIDWEVRDVLFDVGHRTTRFESNGNEY